MVAYQLSHIPHSHYLRAADLRDLGSSYSDLKQASLPGGILKRWKSPKTKRVYYRSLNGTLL